MLKNFAITVRMLLIVLVSIVGILAVGLIGLLNLKEELLLDRKESVKHLVDSARTLVSHFAERVGKDGISEEQAKQMAIATLRDMRFDENNYFFIMGLDGTMVLHPLSPQLEGKSLTETTDPSGRKPFREMVQLARDAGTGFVAYQWTKGSEKIPKPKLSYIITDSKWKWIIGAGIYIDDVDQAFWTRASQEGIIGLTVLLAVIGCTILISRGITRPLSSITKRMDGLAHGDLTIDVPFTDHGDEVGALARSLQVFKDNALRIESLRRAQSEADERAVAERRQALLAPSAYQVC